MAGQVRAHVVIAKKDLLRVLARCQGVADKESTMPVLGNVCSKSRALICAWAATDLYLAVSGTIGNEVERGKGRAHWVWAVVVLSALVCVPRGSRGG